MNIETEVKYIVPDDTTFIALRNLPTLDVFRLKSIGTKVNTDRYLDTGSKAILRAGYACRIRLGKEKRVLTVKSLVSPEGNIHRRQEFETEISSDNPNLWGKNSATGMIFDIIGDEDLKTLFTIFQTRHKYEVFYQNKPIIEFSLDEVSFTNADEVDRFELEAELLDGGTEATLQQFVQALNATWALTPQTKSKFEQAFEFLGIEIVSSQ